MIAFISMAFIFIATSLEYKENMIISGMENLLLKLSIIILINKNDIFQKNNDLLLTIKRSVTRIKNVLLTEIRDLLLKLRIFVKIKHFMLKLNLSH